MGITRNDDPESREFWKIISEARAEVEKWPEWKQNFRVTKYPILDRCESSKSIQSSSEEPNK